MLAGRLESWGGGGGGGGRAGLPLGAPPAVPVPVLGTSVTGGVCPLAGYPDMARALNATGRPIAYSCSWPAYDDGLPPKVGLPFPVRPSAEGDQGGPWDLGQTRKVKHTLRKICNLWATFDIRTVGGVSPWWTVRTQDVLQSWGLATGTGHGKGVEGAGPLRALAQLSSQDPLGIQGRRVLTTKQKIDVFLRPLSKKAKAIVFFSRRVDMPYHFRTSLRALNFTDSVLYEAEDVYTGGIISGLTVDTNITVVINPSGVVMWFLYPIMDLENPMVGKKRPWL
ncbi:alpha-N-acetylgalactosaminidase [Sarcophilus harrisii]|uniref:alpha-N-acetylgalactosaminidase n=1 Tax=Sarcophilus harrisii TaxID=9305 RepID=UPI001301FBB0|nr:alpha-N-acetylgalactosaminidase [Sarcophilus harrisii]